MDILFLGTCACDYSPLLQTTYKDVFDKNARRSSCALINGRHLVEILQKDNICVAYDGLSIQL